MVQVCGKMYDFWHYLSFIIVCSETESLPGEGGGEMGDICVTASLTDTSWTGDVK